MTGLTGWVLLAAGAASISSAAPPGAGPAASAAVTAQPGVYTFETYKVRLAALARQQGVREPTIQGYVPSLRANQRVISMEATAPIAQPGLGNVGTLQPYLRSHVTSSLISRGRANYGEHYSALQALGRRYGVDPTILLAIWGHETSYGAYTGSTDLLEALGSLGYYGRRRAFFENEFVSALKLIDQGVPRSWLKGSWAGATGYPQFMPSVALRVRADGDGDGYADIWRNELDGLASIAAYFRDAGWKPNVTWGIPVRTPPNLDRGPLVNRLNSPRCPNVYRRHSRWLTMREWRALGIMPLGRSIADNEMASLIEPDGPGKTAYLMTTNYRVILDYNCSNFYAISVGVLADAIARR